jgi:alkylation response protein AidB-like acyl-CoA dehydrogenase
MDFREPEHVRMLRESVRAFVAREAPPASARAWDRDDETPRAVFQSLARMGICGLTIPEGYGGAGRDIVAAMAVIEELSRRSLALAVPYIMCACYGGMNIAAAGSEAQKRALLPRLAKGEMLFAYGLTEPDAGADLAMVKTRAQRRGDTIVVNGAKRFCTGAAIADVIYALVRSDAALPKYKNLSFVLIPRAAKGVGVTRMEGMGMRGASLCDVTFDDVTLPLDAVVGEGAGWNQGWAMLAGPVLDVEKLEVAAMALGLATAALDEAWEYAKTRTQFGVAIGAHQAVRHALAENRAQLLAARLVLAQAAWLANQDRPCGVESSMAKLFVCETAERIVLSCQRVMGAYGCVVGADMERMVRDILVFNIAGGSSNIQKNNIANRLGLARAARTR